jgi:hypothetical protein
VRAADRIDVSVVSPRGALLPITETGNVRHFEDEAIDAAAGGPVAYVTAWLEREANTPGWKRRELAARQLEFDFDLGSTAGTPLRFD